MKKRYRAGLTWDELKHFQIVLYSLPEVYADIKLLILGPMHPENSSGDGKFCVTIESKSPIDALKESLTNSWLHFHGFGEKFKEL